MFAKYSKAEKEKKSSFGIQVETTKFLVSFWGSSKLIPF